MMWLKEWLTKFCILTRVIIISTPTSWYFIEIPSFHGFHTSVFYHSNMKTWMEVNYHHYLKAWTTKFKNAGHRKNFDDQLVQQFHFTMSTLRTREDRFPNFTQCVGCCCVTTFLDSLCWVVRVSQAIELYMFFPKSPSTIWHFTAAYSIV